MVEGIKGVFLEKESSVGYKHNLQDTEHGLLGHSLSELNGASESILCLDTHIPKTKFMLHRRGEMRLVVTCRRVIYRA